MGAYIADKEGTIKECNRQLSEMDIYYKIAKRRNGDICERITKSAHPSGHWTV